MCLWTHALFSQDLSFCKRHRIRIHWSGCWLFLSCLIYTFTDDFFSQYIQDYKTPEQKDLARDLPSSLKKNVEFLNSCRPLSVSMNSIIKYLTSNISNCGQLDEVTVSWVMSADLLMVGSSNVAASDNS